MSALQYYVLDTNTIIDLHFGGILQKIFQLPCKFSVTDSLSDELRNPPFRVLEEMGLLFEPLDSNDVKDITPLMERYPATSYVDISVLILARSKNTTLITGDEALRIAAMDNGVDCHGTCWLIDFLANKGILTYSDAIEIYNLILKTPRYPPKTECKTLLSHWKQRKRLLE